MKKKHLKYVYPFKIIDIKTNSFLMEEIENPDSLNIENIEFLIRPSFGFDKEKELVLVKLSIAYIYEASEILKADFDIVFKCEKLDTLEQKNANFLSSLLGISFSTIRGLLISKTASCKLSNVYLPIINPLEIIKNELKDIKEQ